MFINVIEFLKELPKFLRSNGIYKSWIDQKTIDKLFSNAMKNGELYFCRYFSIVLIV